MNQPDLRLKAPRPLCWQASRKLDSIKKSGSCRWSGIQRRTENVKAKG